MIKSASPIFWRFLLGWFFLLGGLTTFAVDAVQPCEFGVMIGGKGQAPQFVGVMKDLGASCVRMNCRLKDRDHEFARFLDAGIDMVITFDNSDTSNMGTEYGTLKEWPNAGFPYRSKEVYQKRIREVLMPLKPFLASGRKIWAQCENEIGDAAINPKSRYWRGTTEQYLIQLRAFREAVESVSPSIPVVLTSFPSESLSALIDGGNPHHEYAERHLTKLLQSPDASVLDLHFYGSVGEIPAKVKAVRDRSPKNKPFLWICTENGGPDFRSKDTPISWKQDQDQFERIQALQVSQRLLACSHNGAQLCLWFSLMDLKKETDVFSHLGLLDQEVLPPRKKPSYEAFKAFVASQKK
jgi:hypothetical protein